MDKNKMSIKQISVRARSKKEIYRILQLEVDVYLLPIQQANRKYIAEIVSRKRKYLKNSQLKAIQVLYFEGLRMSNILSFAKQKCDIDKYLPIFKRPEKVHDREWTCNLMNSLIPVEFKKFIMEEVVKSEQKYAKKQGEEIEIASEFAKLFLEPTTYSRSKEKFCRLLKPTKKETETQNNEEEKGSFQINTLRRSNNEKDNLINELNRKIVLFESEKLEFLDDRAKLAKLYDICVIDSNGEPLYTDLPLDHKYENNEELMNFKL